MKKEEAVEIIKKSCKTKKQKEAFDTLFGIDNNTVKTSYKCHYYHEICSSCIEWPLPENIEEDRADDCCNEYYISAFYMAQEEVAKTGKCKFYMER